MLYMYYAATVSTLLKLKASMWLIPGGRVTHNIFLGDYCWLGQQHGAAGCRSAEWLRPSRDPPSLAFTALARRWPVSSPSVKTWADRAARAIRTTCDTSLSHCPSRGRVSAKPARASRACIVCAPYAGEYFTFLYPILWWVFFYSFSQTMWRIFTKVHSLIT